MRLIAGDAERGPALPAAVIFGSLLILFLSVIVNVPASVVAPIVALVVIACVAYQQLLAWPFLLGATIVVVLFVPMDRYALVGGLPFQLELYRVFAGIVIAAWVTSLLIDPRVRLRRTGLEGPIIVVLAATVASALANPGRIAALGVDGSVIKGITFLVSFFLIVYLIVSVLRTLEDIEFLVRIIVAGGGVVAVLTLIEARTGFNAFNHLSTFIPFLQPVNFQYTVGSRVVGPSSTHIELGAVLVLLVPLGGYLVWRLGRIRWWVATAALGVGAIATLSRTSVVMLLVALVVFVSLRPAAARRLAPALVPVLIATHLIIPGTLGDMKELFFPRGGIVAEQSQHAGWRGGGRVADLPAALNEFSQQPLLGQGYATRQTGRGEEKGDAQILDDQWLKTLLETGLIGIAGWLWLYFRFVGRLAREAHRDESDRGQLLVALAASGAAFAVGMFFFDAFSFIQVTFVLFILLGFGSALTAPSFREARVHAPRATAAPLSAQG